MFDRTRAHGWSIAGGLTIFGWLAFIWVGAREESCVQQAHGVEIGVESGRMDEGVLRPGPCSV
jgi:hypothetical protein